MFKFVKNISSNIYNYKQEISTNLKEGITQFLDGTDTINPSRIELTYDLALERYFSLKNLLSL